MNCLIVFFNNKITYQNNDANDPFIQGTHSFLMRSVELGNKFLAPVRYLCDGNEFIVDEQKSPHYSHHPAYLPQDRNWLRLALAIIFFIPGALAGTFFKGIGHLDQAARSLHYLATMHYTVIDHLTLGGSSYPLDESSLLECLKKAKSNYFQQSYQKITAYAQPFFIDKSEWADLGVQEINCIFP